VSYGRWLRSRGRPEESVATLVTAIAKNPALLEPRYLLMEEYSERREWDNLHALAAQTLELAPADAAAGSYVHASPGAEPPPTADSYIDLSLVEYRAGRYSEAIAAAKEALRLDPKSAEAYNNIAAAYNSMGLWDDGIRAAEEAVRLKPGFPLARNNLAWAQSEKGRTAKR
jgi:protein O-mannosyl-transferase